MWQSSPKKTWRGQVFFVDDNPIGNKGYLKDHLLPARGRSRTSIHFYWKCGGVWLVEKRWEIDPFLVEALPNLKEIVCRGFSLEGPAQEILDAGGQGFVQKPYSLATVSEKMQEVMGGQQAPKVNQGFFSKMLGKTPAD